jgi:glycosyltransferase involved in cell wall biosynthesis
MALGQNAVVDIDAIEHSPPVRAVAPAAVPAAPATRVSVVIPTLNEERNVAWVLERLPNIVDEVILVDGRSTDDTVAVARATRPDIRVVLEATPGKGAALRAGFAAATGDYIVMIDADGSMDPAEIRRYMERLAEGYDLVKGSRFLEGGGSEDISHIRQAGNRALLTLANILYGRRFSELCYGMMAFRADRLDDMDLRSDGFEIETEMVVRSCRAGLRIAEVPSFELPRRYGESNLSAWRDGRRVLKTMLAERIGVRPRKQQHEEPALAELAVAELAVGGVATAEVTASTS